MHKRRGEREEEHRDYNRMKLQQQPEKRQKQWRIYRKKEEENGSVLFVLVSYFVSQSGNLGKCFLVASSSAINVQVIIFSIIANTIIGLLRSID